MQNKARQRTVLQGESVRDAVTHNDVEHAMPRYSEQDCLDNLISKRISSVVTCVAASDSEPALYGRTTDQGEVARVSRTPSSAFQLA